MQKCACGLPLHYTDEKTKRFMEQLVREQGEFIPITIAGGKTYFVQRHYIGLHGIKAEELPSLGFPEVIEE